MGVWKVLILVAMLAGCGGGRNAAPLGGTVSYGKSGGIAGVVQKLTVSPKGRAVASSSERKRAFTLSRAQLKRLTAAVEKADLAHTRSPKDDAQGADGFAFGVSYRGHSV